MLPKQVLRATLLAAVALSLAAPPVHANPTGVTVAWCNETVSGVDYHDTYEDELDNHPTGEIRACYSALFTIPSNAKNGDKFTFRFWMNPILGQPNYYPSIAVDYGCGGWANNPPNQVTMGTVLSFLNQRAEQGIICVGTVTVGSHPHWSPGQQLQISMSMRIKQDWECFNDDPETTLHTTCQQKWRAQSLDGGSHNYDDRTVVINYFLLPLPI